MIARTSVEPHPSEFRETVMWPARDSARWPRGIAAEFEISVDPVRARE